MPENKPCGKFDLLVSRRNFLLAGSTIVTLAGLPGSAQPTVKARLKDYPKKKIANLSDLKQDEPIVFNYPDDKPTSMCQLFKLGVPAGGGIGQDNDIVAFSAFCTHMGGPLLGVYKKEYKALGSCPMHLTTFDLTRFGIVIAGHATVSLPQIYLEIKEGEVYATGILGLVYGHHES